MTLLALLAASMLGAAPAAPGGDAARERVETLLGSIDTPVPAVRWKALGPAGGAALAEIARDEGRMPTARARAMAALAAADPAAAEGVARDLADAPDAPPVVRQEAVRALGHLLAPAALRSALAPLLRAGPAAVRPVAAETLARRAPALSCAEVIDQAGRESPRDRVRFERAVALCAGEKAGR